MWASCSWPSVHSPPARPRAQDGQLCFTGLDTLSSAGRVRQDHGDAVTAVAASPAAEHLVYASAGQAVLAVDVRKARVPASAPLWPGAHGCSCLHSPLTLLPAATCALTLNSLPNWGERGGQHACIGAALGAAG